MLNVNRAWIFRCTTVSHIVLACGGRYELDGLDGTPATAPAGGGPTSQSGGATSVAVPVPEAQGGVPAIATSNPNVTTNASAGSGSGSGSATAATTAVGPCTSLIDDMEDGSGHIRRCAERQGVWYAFTSPDVSGSMWPEVNTPGVPIETSAIEGGRGSSRRAIHAYGSSVNTANWLAGIGIDLAFDGVTYGTFDASAYRGVTFWIRGSASPGFSGFEFRISTTSTTLTEYGGTCEVEPCWPHGDRISLTSEWQKVSVPFTALTRYVSDDPFQPSQITNLQFYCSEECQSFDIWVDDIAFY